MNNTHSVSAILLATTTSELLTHPLEVVKTKTQLKSANFLSTTKPQSPFKMMAHYARTGGVRKLYKGFSPSLMRGVQIQSIRFGLYDNMDQKIQNYFSTGNSISLKSLSIKTVSALFSSFVAGFISNPWIVLKIRMIADKSGEYNTLTRSVKTIIANDGYREFFKGTSLSMVRGTVLSTAELITYDSLKTVLKTKDGFDPKACLIASVLSSFSGALVSYPFDILRTAHVSKGPNDAAMKSQTKQIIAKFKEICVKSGPRGLYAGFFTYLSRALIYGPLFWNSLEVFNYLTNLTFNTVQSQKVF